MSAFAASDSTNAFEKSYPRDNTFCALNQKRVEFIIHGGNKYTEPKERGYGEFLFYRNPEKRPKLLNMNRSGSDTFSFFKGQSSACSKSYGFKLDETTLAVLFKRENRPFKDLLTIQQFDFKTLAPKEVIETNYPVEKIEAMPDGFRFKVIPENHSREFGKVSIEGQDYIYREDEFPIWMGYTLKGFETQSDVTFNKFPWKKHFRDQDDFLTASGWNPELKKFSKTIIYVAVNHKVKKKCLLLLENKQRPSGNESWRCQTM